MGIQNLHVQIYVQYTHRLTLTHRHLYMTLLHTHHTHRDKHSHRNTHTCIPPTHTHTHHSHRKTLPVCVPVCMYSPRLSSSQPWISVPCLLLRRATVDLYTMAFPLGFFIRSYGSWSGYPAVSSEPVAVPLELGRKCQIA